MQKIMRINMTEGLIASVDAGPDYELFGGRGLIAKILTDEVDPTCDPLGPNNKLIFCPGLLGDTPAPCSGRLSIGGKSPLTGTIKEANAGGTFAQRMVGLGLKALVLEGKPTDNDWSILVLDESGGRLISAAPYSGMNNYELADALRGNFGTEISVASIGCAGERGYATSTIQISDLEGHPSRAAGRGGLGAVMGSKKIKAIIAHPARLHAARYHDKAAFMDKNRQFTKAIMSHPFTGQGLPALGTAMLVAPMNGMGVLPTKNFSHGTFDQVDAISGEQIAILQGQRGGVMKHKCHNGCVIQCSQIYNDEEGNYLTSGFEYETIGLVGANCGIADIDTIARIDRACDDLGVDTMDTGCAIAVSMEAGKLPFGDGDGAMNMIEEMRQGTEMGRLLGMGTASTGQALGVARIPAVKGQSMAAYDPRGLKGTGITYATSPMGADHTAGNTVSVPGDPGSKKGKIEASRNCQVGFALLDNLGLCLFAGVVFDDPVNLQHVVDMMAAKFGGSWNIDRLMGLAMQNLTLEKQFNRGAGFTAADDRLPDFFKTEKLPGSELVFDLTDAELDQVLPM